jgi:NAD+ diphosphatase
LNPKKITYCPQCASPLQEEVRGGKTRKVCPDQACGFVFWNNPVPVVAAIVEWKEQIVLVRSIGWPEGWFGLVTGFLEAGETPEEAVIREVGEETGLKAQLGDFIGTYPFFQRNQLILAYHVRAEGETITLDSSELEAYKALPIDQVKPWPMGTGIALRDWLRSRGYERAFMQL